MADPAILTAPVAELLDPLEHPPPRGQTLLVINEGGVLLKSHWYAGALAWGPLPRIPASVKARQEALLLQKQQQESERFSDQQSHPQLQEVEARGQG